MNSLMLFWHVVLNELGTWCRVSTDRSLKTASTRYENEGDEFLTIVLPNFGKDFERSLDRGEVTPDLFPYWGKKGKLPKFLGEFMELVFDRETGRLNEMTEDYPYNEDVRIIDAIYAVRQLTLMFGKIEKRCTPEREQAAIDSYFACEAELVHFENEIHNDLDVTRLGHHLKGWDTKLESFRYVSKWLFGKVFTQMDGDVYYGILGKSHERHEYMIPKHGPGATADRLLGNEKYDQTEWTRRLEEGGFPYGEYAIPNWRYYYLLDRVKFREPGEELPVKVTLVPKTQKTPRVIAIEPTCMQYAQQAIATSLIDYLEAPSSGLRGMIGFSDQTPNQRMARIGSHDGSMATLDLSEASDRVSNLLVLEMFERWPHLNEVIQASRSKTADVFGTVIPLSKFASMGSALCFPVEAMVFLTVVWIGICKATGRPLSESLIKEYSGRVRVYGDDIIVPTDFATAVAAELESFGFRVNAHKSFWTGRFRESCGGDFYAGEDVTVTRVRRDIATHLTEVPEVLSTVSLRNQLFSAGLMSSVSYLDRILGKVLKYYPKVHPDSSIVSRHTALDYDVEKVSEALQSPLVKGWVVNSRIPKSPISGEGALLKCLGKKELLPFEDPRHLERQGRPETVRLKLRYRQPF